MWQLIISAFVIGVLGSFHCVGMCGPIALTLPLNNTTAKAKFTGALIYNIGRVVTYAIFGLIFGLIGKSFAFFGFQQWLSVCIGILLLIGLLLPGKIFFIRKSGVINSFLLKVRLSLQQLLTKKQNSSLFAVGLLNGLLPCGLVYMAIAGAIASASIVNSILFMIFFGLGTLPMMWSVAFFGNYISINIRTKIRKAYPYIVGGMACLFIVRGMGMGIPYLSPKLEPVKKEIHGCCSKPI